MKWHADFVGREPDLAALQAAWEEARAGTPRVFAIVAESGFGKTRLAQEFYNWLSANQDGIGEAGYWPDVLLREEDNLRVNPQLPGHDDALGPMPFLWWGLRLADPGARNAIVNSAFATGLQNLNPHLAAMQREMERAEIKRQRLLGGGKTASDVALSVGETAIEVVSSVGTFGLLGLAKTLGEAAWDHRTAVRELKALDARDIRPAAAEGRERDRLAETAIADLARLCYKPPHGIDPIPLVILVDDVQWLGADDGTVSFLNLLMARARAENWPLLLVLTSWRREWRSSQKEAQMPAALADLTRGDVVHELGPLADLDSIIAQVFSGLTAEQVAALSDKAEGTPRLMDEMLMYMARRRKAFVGRDTAAALTEAGLTDVLERDFAEFIADRLEQAPDHVRRALAIASMQGVSFSPRLVQRLAEGLKIVDAETGLQEGEDPHSFVTAAHLSDASEFRLRAYRAAAREDLGNLMDEVDAEDSLRDALDALTEDVEAATDQELALILNAPEILDEDPDPWRDRILIAGGALVKRAYDVDDSRRAGALAQDLLLLITDDLSLDKWGELIVIIDALMEWQGPSQALLDAVHPFLERLDGYAVDDEGLDTYFKLSGLIRRYADLTEALHGPHTALASRIDDVKVARYVADEAPSQGTQIALYSALTQLGSTYTSLSQISDALRALEESASIVRGLIQEDATAPLLQTYLSSVLSYLSQTLLRAGRTEDALPIVEEMEQVCARLARSDPRATAKTNWGLALSQKASVTNTLYGDNAALPIFKQAVAVLRQAVSQNPIPNARGALSTTLSRLGTALRSNGDTSAAGAALDESVAIMRVLVSEMPVPGQQSELAAALLMKSMLHEQEHGSADARPILEEGEIYARAAVEAHRTPESLKRLALISNRLGHVFEDLEGIDAARPHFENAEAVMAELVDMSYAPYIADWWLPVLRKVADITEALDGPKQALPLREKEAAFVRSVVSNIPLPQTPSPELRREFAGALIRLADTLEEDQSAIAAYPVRREAETMLRGVLSDEETPSDVYELVQLLTKLALTLSQQGDAAAAHPLQEEATALAENLYEASRIGPNARTLRDSLGMLVEYTEHVHSAADAVPICLREEAISRLLAETCPEPWSQLEWAFSLRRLSQLYQNLDDHEAAIPHRQQELALRRSLAKDDPTADNMLSLADALDWLGDLYVTAAAPAKAVALRTELVALRRDLANTDPSALNKCQLALALGSLADALAETDGPRATRALRQEAEQRLSEVARTEPDPAYDLTWGIALHNRANLLFELGDIPDAKQDWRAAVTLFHGLDPAQAPADAKLWHLVTEQYLLSAELLGPDPWNRAFARETPPPTAHDLLDRMMGNRDAVKDWAEDKATNDAKGRVIEAEFEYARCLTAQGNLDSAQDVLQRLDEELHAAMSASPEPYAQLALRLSQQRAVLGLAQNQAEEALAPLNRAQSLIEFLPAHSYTTLRHKAVVAWFHSEAHMALAAPDLAREHLATELGSVEAFAALKVMDGAAILSAWQAALKV